MDKEFLTHTYNAPALYDPVNNRYIPYTIVVSSCCRTLLTQGINKHINNPGKPYRIEADIDFRGTTASPISLLPPIVDCPAESDCEFHVTAVDPDVFDPEETPNLRYRLATAQEMGGSDLRQPEGANIDPKTGLYTWNTRGIALAGEGYNTLYSTQVVIEDRVYLVGGNVGELNSRVVLDFFIRIKNLPDPPANTIAIPLRWCGVRGSPSIEDPTLLNMPIPSFVLMQRTREMNDIYLRQANIMFVSGSRYAQFPIIDGPIYDNRENPNGHFRLNYASTYRDLAVNACRLAWSAKDPGVTGMIAVNFNRFVLDDMVTPTNAYYGIARIPSLGDPGKQILDGVATVIDWAYFVQDPDPSLPEPWPSSPDLLQKWLAHELGHGLGLDHLRDGENLMDDRQQANRGITLLSDSPDQISTIRSEADLIPDRIKLDAIQSFIVGSTWPDSVQDAPVTESFIDIDATGMSIRQDQAKTYLVASTFGRFPDNLNDVNYTFLVDADNNSSTGGSPSQVGVPSTTQGIELIGRVEVSVNAGTPQGAPTVWKFQGSQFVQVSDPSIQALVDTLFGAYAPAYQTPSEPTPSSQIIQLVLSNDIRGPIADNVRFLVVAENINTGTVDSVEGSITFVPPAYPVCQVEPNGALLGSTVNVSAQSLPINQAISVFLGTEQIGTGLTDGTGSVNMDVVIPTNTSTGTRQISVYVDGTAVAADCVIQLWSYPKFDVPPSPSSGSSFVVNPGATLNFTIQASDLDAGDVITLDVIGLPPGASFPIPLPSNPASATFSWTPTSDQAGSYVVVFTARDSLGLSGTPVSVIITVQAPPTACTPSNSYGKSQGLFHFASFKQSPLLADFNRLPLAFVPNRGQEDQAVRFQAQGLGGRLFFTPSEVVFSLPNPVKVKEDDKEKIRYDLRPANVVRIHYQGANDNPEVEGTGQLPGVVNVLKGNNPSKWRANLPTYSGIAYRELYPGIELRYEGIEGKLKSTFYVAPGADPSAIVWRYKGASDVNIDESGNLVISLPEPAGNGAVLVEQAPIAWQGVGENRVMVAVQYVIDKKDKKVSFLFSDGYDSTLPLIIDPTLTYSTYLGGGTTDEGDAITLDSDCNIYLTGVTYSTNFPTETPIQTNQPGSDVFVSKLSATGNTLLYSTYIGGSGSDHAWSINRDIQGRITIVGETESSNFPTMNAYDTSYGGGTCSDGPCDDVFVTQLLADGSALRYSTYLGGNKDDEAYSIVLGPDDMIYLTGLTESSTFPTTANGYDRIFGGGTCSGYPCEDAFVAKINPALIGTNSLLYSTFLGGSDYDKGRGIALDASGKVYVAGFTRSDNYPTLTPYQAARADNSDIFVTKLDTTLSGAASLLYSTYFGGSGSEHAYGLALNGANQIYLTGFTQSTNFPLANPFDNSFGGGTCGSSACYDAYVTHLDIASNNLVSSSYLGGSNEEQGGGITVDDSGNVYVTGYTKSTNFTTVAAIQSTKGADSCSTPPCADAFVVKVSATGYPLTYSTYLGGSMEDFGNAIVVDGLGGAYIVGYTFSSNFPTTPGSFPYVGGSGYADAFVVKIDD